MHELLEWVRIFFEELISTLGYVGIFITTFIEGVFPPIPSEVILPFSGFLVQKGELNFLLVLIATTLGSLAGAFVFYYAGKLLGEQRIRKAFRKYGKYALLSEKDFDKSLTFFNTNSRSIIFWSRFIPGIRSIISIPAGVAHMPLIPFVFLTILGTAGWNTALIVAGMYLGEQWEVILTYTERYDTFFYVLIGLLIVGWIILRRVQLTQNKKQD